MGITDTLILLSSCAVEIYLFYSFFENLFEKRMMFKDSKLIRLGISCLAVLILFMGNALGNGDLNAIWVPIVALTYIMIMFQGKIGNKILYFLIAFLIIFGCEWLFAIVLSVDNDAYKKMSEMPFIILALKLLTYILFVIVEQFVGKQKKKMDNWTFLKFLSLPVSGFGIMLVVFYSGVDFTVKPEISLLMTMCYILLLFGNIIVFYAFNKYSEELYTNMENQILITKQQADLNYFVKMAEQQEDHNEFVHNTTHYLGTIRKFAQLKDYNSILKMVGELDNHMIPDWFWMISVLHLKKDMYTG